MNSESMRLRKVFAYRESWAWQRLRRTWLGDAVRASRSAPRELWAWSRAKSFPLPEVAKLEQSLSDLQLVSNDPDDTEAPIFLLSTGWRAGSTLLQRILITDSRLLLWGEPLGEMGVLARITDMLADSMSPRSVQLWKDQPDPGSPGLAQSWVANLSPHSTDFRRALREMVDRWLRIPAATHGFARWGLKEVRLGAADALVLR